MFRAQSKWYLAKRLASYSVRLEYERSVTNNLFGCSSGRKITLTCREEAGVGGVVGQGGVGGPGGVVGSGGLASYPGPQLSVACKLEMFPAVGVPGMPSYCSAAGPGLSELQAELGPDQFSDTCTGSGSDSQEDLFSDLSSSLESLHSIDAFNFFNEKQNLHLAF